MCCMIMFWSASLISSVHLQLACCTVRRNEVARRRSQNMHHSDWKRCSHCIEDSMNTWSAETQWAHWVTLFTSEELYITIADWVRSFTHKVFWQTCRRQEQQSVLTSDTRTAAHSQVRYSAHWFSQLTWDSGSRTHCQQRWGSEEWCVNWESETGQRWSQKVKMCF